MRTLNPNRDLDEYFDRIARARECVLLTDYDGTLAPFQVRPERAHPYPGVARLLDEIMAQGGTRVVVVSGRSLGDLLPLLKLKRQPEVWGAHGWQRLLPDGQRLDCEPGAETHARLSEAARIAQDCGCDVTRLEFKPASVALHWRGLPALKVARLRDRVSEAWRALASDERLELMGFDGGLELRAPAFTKGHAVRTVLAETAEPGAVAYLGDDVTDEDAFTAVKPYGLAVLVRRELRETAADLWIRPPRELIAFLRRWSRAAALRIPGDAAGKPALTTC
jgi:trehalose 6-phosphate phosphatase